jgi:hypothetical protein
MTAHQWTRSRQGQRKRRLPKVVAGLLAAGAYWFPIRRRFRQYGLRIRPARAVEEAGSPVTVVGDIQAARCQPRCRSTIA